MWPAGWHFLCLFVLDCSRFAHRFRLRYLGGGNSLVHLDAAPATIKPFTEFWYGRNQHQLVSSPFVTLPLFIVVTIVLVSPW